MECIAGELAQLSQSLCVCLSLRPSIHLSIDLYASSIVCLYLIHPSSLYKSTSTHLELTRIFTGTDKHVPRVHVVYRLYIK